MAMRPQRIRVHPLHGEGQRFEPSVAHPPHWFLDLRTSPHAGSRRPPSRQRALRLRPLVIADAVALNRIQFRPGALRFYPHPFDLREVTRMDRGGRRATSGMGSRCSRSRIGRRPNFSVTCGPVVQIVDGVNEVELAWLITRARAPGDRDRGGHRLPGVGIRNARR